MHVRVKMIFGVCGSHRIRFGHTRRIKSIDIALRWNQSRSLLSHRLHVLSVCAFSPPLWQIHLQNKFPSDGSKQTWAINVKSNCQLKYSVLYVSLHFDLMSTFHIFMFDFISIWFVRQTGGQVVSSFACHSWCWHTQTLPFLVCSL